MKLKSSVKKLMLLLLIVCAYYFINANKSYAYTNHTLQEAMNWLQSKVGTYVEYDYYNPPGANGAYYYQCTDLIYAYYDYLAGQSKGGDATSYVWNNDKLIPGWTFTTTPTQGDIVVWGTYAQRGYPNLWSAYTEGFGHVGIVWTVNSDGTIDTIENNGEIPNQGPCKAYKRNPSQVACYIHPDFYDQTPTKPNIPSNMLNLGDNFYAYMMMSNNWDLFNVDVNDNVVLQQGVWQDKKQIWNFIRQTDGSYVIKNVNTGRYLDVYNSNDYDGGIVRTFTYNGSNAQKYFLYGTQDKCVIRPACSTTRVVSVDGGVNSVGQKLNMWEYWGVETQLFYIWKVDEAKASTLNYSINDGKVTLNWTKGENADKYNIIIKSGTPGNVKEYKKIVDIVGTSYNITLPAGYYEVVVEGWNYFSNAFSNVVKFTNGSIPIDITPYLYDATVYTSVNQDVKNTYKNNATKIKSHWTNIGIKEGRTASLVFDAKYYLSKYPDLKKAFGNNYAKTYRHFVNVGINEGRQGSRFFNAKYYLEKYPELKQKYKDNYSQALKHFVTEGIKAGKVGSAEFNVGIYKANYPDLSSAYGNNYAIYYRHYINIGLKERRNATTSISTVRKLTTMEEYLFNVEIYANKNADIKKAYNNDKTKMKNHWIKMGIKEGRVASVVFDAKYYLSKYLDLKKAFGNNYEKAYNHFLNVGLKEGRQGSPYFNAKKYVENNGDLKAAFGTNYTKALRHYVKVGINENRKAI